MNQQIEILMAAVMEHAEEVKQKIKREFVWNEVYTNSVFSFHTLQKPFGSYAIESFLRFGKRKSN